MKKLPVLQITKDAYTFVFAKTKNIFPMFIQCSMSIILPYIFLHLVKDHLGFSTGATLSSMTGVIFLTFTLLALLTVFLQTPLNISAIRAIVTQEEISKDYFKLLLTSRTRKTFLTVISTILLLIVTLAGTAAAIAGLFFITSFFNLQGIGLKFLTIISIILGSVFILHVSLRLFLAIPNASLDNEQPIRLSWQALKGQLIRLLVIAILACIPNIVWTSIASFLLNVSLQTNPLVYGLISLPQLYFGFIPYAALGLVYKHLNK